MWWGWTRRERGEREKGRCKEDWGKLDRGPAVKGRWRSQVCPISEGVKSKAKISGHSRRLETRARGLGHPPPDTFVIWGGLP